MACENDTRSLGALRGGTTRAPEIPAAVKKVLVTADFLHLFDHQSLKSDSIDAHKVDRAGFLPLVLVDPCVL